MPILGNRGGRQPGNSSGRRVFAADRYDAARGRPSVGAKPLLASAGDLIMIAPAAPGRTFEHDPDAVTERARELFEGRIVAVRALAKARRNTLARRFELEELERLEGAAYAAAIRAGCTPDELKTLGFETPARRRRGRPRSARSRPAQPHRASADPRRGVPADGTTPSTEPIGD